ncbi:Methylcytosine dioxygenase TET1 [Plecturocebus cupreus]
MHCPGSVTWPATKTLCDWAQKQCIQILFTSEIFQGTNDFSVNFHFFPAPYLCLDPAPCKSFQISQEDVSKKETVNYERQPTQPTKMQVSQPPRDIAKSKMVPLSKGLEKQHDCDYKDPDLGEKLSENDLVPIQDIHVLPDLDRALMLSHFNGNFLGLTKVTLRPWVRPQIHLRFLVLFQSKEDFGTILEQETLGISGGVVPALPVFLPVPSNPIATFNTPSIKLREKFTISSNGYKQALSVAHVEPAKRNLEVPKENKRLQREKQPQVLKTDLDNKPVNCPKSESMDYSTCGSCGTTKIGMEPTSC